MGSAYHEHQYLNPLEIDFGISIGKNGKQPL